MTLNLAGAIVLKKPSSPLETETAWNRDDFIPGNHLSHPNPEITKLLRK